MLLKVYRREVIAGSCSPFFPSSPKFSPRWFNHARLRQGDGPLPTEERQSLPATLRRGGGPDDGLSGTPFWAVLSLSPSL